LQVRDVREALAIEPRKVWKLLQGMVMITGYDDHVFMGHLVEECELLRDIIRRSYAREVASVDKDIAVWYLDPSQHAVRIADANKANTHEALCSVGTGAFGVKKVCCHLAPFLKLT